MTLLADQTLPGFGNQPIWITLIKVVGVFAFLDRAGVPLAQIDHVVVGAPVGDAALELRVTAVLVPKVIALAVAAGVRVTAYRRVLFLRVRTEHPSQLAVPALAEQMEIEVAERRQEAVRVVVRLRRR